MNNNNNAVKVLITAAVFATVATQGAHASGFSLYTEASGAAVGNYGAGIAAEGADASIGWYNPAGLVLIDKPQLVFSGVGIAPNTPITGTSTFAVTPASPLLLPPYVQNFNNLSGSKKGFVPAFHYAKPLGERATFALSVVSPFGLATEYEDTSAVRYAATFTELLTVNVSPELGGKLTDNFSVGLGLDLQWARVKFNRMLGAPILAPAVPGFTATTLDSASYNRGHSFGVGFHAGVLGVSDDKHTRVGLNYQSKMRHDFHGFSRLTGPLADPTVTAFNVVQDAVFRSDNLSSNEIDLPDVITLSVYRDLNDRVALLGSAVYTGWSVFKKVTLNNVAAGSPTLGQFLASSTAVQDYKDTWRFSAGANFKANELIMLRAGVGYDQTPTVDAERDVRLPDINRWALACGGHYQAFPSVGIDFGYSYIGATKESTLNKTDPQGVTATGVVTSTYNVNARTNKGHAHLFGLQAVWSLDTPEKSLTK